MFKLEKSESALNLRSQKIVKVKTYKCTHCGYTTGNQAEKFKYCPMCGKGAND